MSDPSARAFSASYDTTTKIISAVCVLVFAAVAAFAPGIAVAGIAVLGVAAAYAWSPRGYTIEERVVRVHRLIGDARFPLQELRDARIAGAGDLCGCLRLFGNGGLFGYYGLFRTSKLGRCTWYVTNRANTVVVVTARKTALFSPDDVEGFLSAVGAATTPAPAMPQPVTARGSGIWRAAGIVAAVACGLAAVAAVAFAFAYSPGPPAYTLTPQALTIHDRFYPVTLHPESVDVAHIRLIDFDLDKEWLPTARTNGFANGRYRSGWFRVAGGRTVRMYQADSRRLVLLPPKVDGPAVLLQTIDPEEFMRAVRRQWPTRS